MLNFFLARGTSIHALRRSGYGPTDIMKMSGHKSVDTLITSYDHGLDIAEKIDMAAAICYGPQLNRGEVAKVKGIILKYFLAI